MRGARGFVKLVADASSGRILGAHIVGHEAWELAALTFDKDVAKLSCCAS